MKISEEMVDRTAEVLARAWHEKPLSECKNADALRQVARKALAAGLNGKGARP